ncbi:hypothetical protein HS99_0016735 [Kitasatospora aureofaciens]|uniref:DUF1360 domain-containing protein n=1 Tax=Kitasatospora aureofaciens TaxID=1894 RepID=A0A1E7MV93_KITAU|nr:DUF1360 domain-containing protein [Kitasatospora aureofaciens]OEV32347.1 hypothetical protein HS99_0016735 [Kitasatospora aureofaciens]
MVTAGRPPADTGEAALLITCPFCGGLWIATGLTGAQVFAPGATRLVCSGLTALTVADLLHFVRVGLQNATD